MGVSTSSLPPTREELLATLEPADERLLLRNFQLLAAHDPALPGTFGAAEWFAFHAAMPPRLREATLAGLRGDDGSINLDTVVRAITLPTQAAADAALLWHDCLPTAALPEMLQACTEAAEWLAQLESTAHAGRAAEWARLRGAFDADQARGAAARASRPVSRAAFAESVVASAPLLAGARVIAATVQAAWLLDYRKLQPLPQLEQGGSALLRPADLRLLAEALPPQCRHRWRLLFSAARDGASFSRLCALTVGRAPVLLVVRDTGGAVFGGACTQPLQKAPRFFGEYTCFLYTLQPQPAIHRASGENSNFVYLNQGMEQLPNGLAFGGQLDARFFGLWLHDDLETGRSCAPCSTYQDMHAVLASSGDFRVDAVELWAVNEDVPVDDEPQGTALDGVMGEQHAETRSFLQMAGKTQHAATLTPEPVAQ